MKVLSGHVGTGIYRGGTNVSGLQPHQTVICLLIGFLSIILASFMLMAFGIESHLVMIFVDIGFANISMYVYRYILQRGNRI